MTPDSEFEVLHGSSDGPSPGFAGREWALARVDAWLRGDEPSMLITGGPGSGKSALAAKLAQISDGRAPAVGDGLREGVFLHTHVCRALDPSRIDPLRFVELLSTAIANAEPRYADALAKLGDQRIEIQGSVSAGRVESGAAAAGVLIETVRIGHMSATLGFERVIRAPLSQIVDGTRRHVVLIDALDEALTLPADETLVDLLGDALTSGVPLAGLRLVMTTRPDPRVLERLPLHDRFDLVADAPVDPPAVEDPTAPLDDIGRYALDRLAGRGVAAEPTARRVAAAAAGNFLFARYILDELAVSGSLDLEDAPLPSGLDDLYRQYLGRELARSRETWEERYRPLLGALAVARGAGLSRTHLAGTVALPASRVDDALLRLRQYITGPSPDGPFRLYHQSFRDFLLKDQAYHVYADEASAAIAAFLLRRHAANWLDCHDDYALENVAGHLIDAVRFDAAAGSAPGELDRLRGLMTDLTYVAARARRFGAASAEADVGQTEKLVPGDMALPTLRRQLAQVGPLLDRAPTAPDVAATLLTRLSHLPALQRSVDDLARTLPMPHLRARTPLPDSGHPALVRALELVSEPAGCAIAADGTLIVWLQDQIQVWDTTTGTQLRHFSLRPDVGALSADATTGAFVFGAERRLEIWDCLTGTRRRTIELTDAIAACCTSADGRFVVTAGRSGAVDVWDARTGVRLRTATATPPIVTCGVSGDAAVVVCHRGRTSHLPRGEAEWEDVFPEGPLELVSSGSDRELPAALARATADSFSISADGTTLLVALKPDESDGSDNADEPDDVETASTARFSVFDLDSGQETVITAHETVGWSGCLVSHDGSVAVTLDSYDALSAWHRDAGEIAVFKETHPTAARLLALSPRGELAVSAVGEEISVWDTRMRGTRTSPEGRTAWTVSPFCGGSRLLCPFYEGVVEVWETENGTAVDRLPATESSLTGGVASEDGAIAVIAEGVNFDGTPPVKVWNLPARRVEQVVLGAEAFGGELAMSRDGELVLMTREHEGRKLAAIWRTGIGAFDPTLLPDAQAGSAYALSREGGVAAIGFDDGTVELWHGLATRVRCAAAHAQRVIHAEFGVADRRLVTSAADGTVRIWDQQGRQEHCLVHGGDGAWLRGCTLSPDGRHAASVDASGCLKLWRLSDQACVLTQYFYGVLFECVWYRARELVLAGTGGVYLMSVLLDV